MIEAAQRWRVQVEYRLADDEPVLSPSDGRVPMLAAWLADAYRGDAVPTSHGWTAEVTVAAGPEVHFIGEAEELGVRLIEECVAALELPRCAIVSRAAEDLDTASDSPEIYGSRELAVLLGISRQRLLQLRSSGVVPSPDVELAATPVWWRSTVERMMWAWRRRPGPPPEERPRSGQRNLANTATKGAPRGT